MMKNEMPNSSNSGYERERWLQPVPPRNWRRWGGAYAAHFMTGLIAGFGVGFAAGATPAAGNPLYLAAALSQLLSIRSDLRQTVESIRRNDTPGRDMGDSIAGWCIGLLSGAGVGAVLGLLDVIP